MIGAIALSSLRRRFLVLGALLALLGTGWGLAQDLGPGAGVEFRFAGRSVVVPRIGSRLEILPVLSLLGAEAGYSPAAQTYGVTLGDDFIQFALDRRFILVNGKLDEVPDAPTASPAGVAASVQFLERGLLGPLGYHLEAITGGYRIMPGARFAEPVAVRPAAADFGATTTLVLTFDRPVETAVTDGDGTEPTIHFSDASPRLDSTLTFQSRRVQRLLTQGQDLKVELPEGVGLLSWHLLDDPPRVILELGRRRPTPVPEAVNIAERSGPPPIVIDPGHGGDDTGAVAADGLMEKNLVLDIARRLERRLTTLGYPVRLTRTGDDSRALSDRTALANRLQARVFVSLHANASTVAAVRGAETYYMSLDASSTDAHAAATADLENQPAQAGSTSSSLDLILWDLAQAEVLNESSRLALDTQKRLNERLGLRDRGVKQAPFVVLTGATMPAILVEVGFLSNPEEARRLAGADYRDCLAEAIAGGIDDFVRSQ